MPDDKHLHLSRRERQIMDILYAQGEVTVNDVQAQLPNPPTHTAVRTLLRILMDKGMVRRKKQGREYIYRAKPARSRAGQSAMQRVVQTFFDGSLEKAVSSYLAQRNVELSDQEHRRLRQLLDEARNDNR